LQTTKPTGVEKAGGTGTKTKETTMEIEQTSDVSTKDVNAAEVAKTEARQTDSKSLAGQTLFGTIDGVSPRGFFWIHRDKRIDEPADTPIERFWAHICTVICGRPEYGAKVAFELEHPANPQKGKTATAKRVQILNRRLPGGVV
jgi:hypothetical protein